MRFINFFIIFFTLLNLIKCNSNKQKQDNLALFLILSDSFTGSNPNTEFDKLITTTQESSGVYLTVVNATSTKSWTLVDLKAQAKYSATNWDLRFKRFVIGTNSGSSGNLLAAACDSGLTVFQAVTENTSCKTGTNFEVDIPMSQTGGGSGAGDVNESASPVLFNWYNYSNTILTAKTNVYLIRGSDGNSLFKLQMTDYYSKSGTSGYPSFRWSKLK